MRIAANALAGISLLTNDEIEEEGARLVALPLDALRKAWRVRFGDAPPLSRVCDLVVRAWIYRLEVERHGPMRPALKRRLTDLAACFAEDQGFDPMPRARPRPGTALVRDWNGVRHVVLVTASGFQFGESIYSSLTPIAKAITGQHQSGPRFFGLTGNKPVRVGAPDT